MTEAQGRRRILRNVGVAAVHGRTQADTVSAHYLLGWPKVDQLSVHIVYAFHATSHRNARLIITSAGM